MRVRLKQDRLAELIARSGLSQNHWALRLGLSRGHWSDIVNGNHPYPSARTRQLLLDGFEVRFEELFAVDAGSNPSDVSFQVALGARYVIDRELGQGGMGTVFLARDVTLGRAVAIKAISTEAVSGVGVDRFLQETAWAARLQHPHIVPLYDAGAAAGQPFYVMPWVRGGSLRELLDERQRLPLDEALPILRGIAAALEHAHAQQVLHCDIKPGNVLLDGQHAYVADFGIARVLRAEAADWKQRGSLDSSAGTPAYVSPEQASGDEGVDGRSDLYSLACVAFEMLAGRPPFAGRTTRDMVAQRFVAAPPELSRLVPDVARGVSGVIARAMSLRREDRQASVGAFMDDLASAVRSRMPAPVVRARAGVFRVHRKLRRQLAAWPGAAALSRTGGALARELRFTLRGLLRQPAFAFTAILTLALAISANTSLFSVVRFLMLDRLPVASPGELAFLDWYVPQRRNVSGIQSSGRANPAGRGTMNSNVSYPMYRQLADAARAVGTDVTGYMFVREVSFTVGSQPPGVAAGMMVDGRYFATLGLATIHGRPLVAADDQTGGPPVVVLAYGFWQRWFGGDPSAVGRTIRINGSPFEVVGITPAGFVGLSRGGFIPQIDVTVPLSTQPLVTPEWTPQRGSLFASEHNWIRMLARVPAGSSPVRFVQAMSATLTGLVPASPDTGLSPPAVHLEPAEHGERGTRREGERQLLILSGVAALVLLIACVNLATLMLARGVARQRELAVRRALGASRVQLARQVLLECLALATAGAAAGLVLTLLSRGLLTSLLSVGLSSFGAGPATVMQPRLDALLFLVTAAVGVIAATLSGLLPALRATRLDPASHLGHLAAGGAPRLTLGRVLIAVQIACSVPLVMGSLLFLRTLQNLGGVELGFDPRGVTIFRLSPKYAGVPIDQQARFYLEVLRVIETLPGVTSATLVENALMSGLVSNNSAVIDGVSHNVLLNSVGPRYFETMGIPLIAGRGPEPLDRDSAPQVAAINQAAVRQLFGGHSPIGRTMRVGSRDITIVGVVGDSRYHRQRTDVEPTVFDAALQRFSSGGHHVVVKAALPLGQLDLAIRRAVAAVDPDLPVPDLRSQEEQIARSTRRERLMAQLLTAFGLFALLLASIGVHGVVAYSVARRTNEMGVRIALGAGPGHVLWLVLRQVLVLAGIGVAIGVPLTLAATRLVRALLFGVAPGDPLALVAAAGIMLAMALGAGLPPALRAARLDPVRALRAD